MRRFFLTLIAITSGLFTLFFAGVSAVQMYEAVSVTETALAMDMRAAVERAKSGRSAWVALSDASADCKRFVTYADTSKEGETRDAVLFVAANSARDLEIVVDARDVRDCASVAKVHYVGMLKRLDDDRRSHIAGYGLALPAGGNIEWRLCAVCVTGDEWMIAIVLAVLALLSAWFTLKMFRARTPARIPARPDAPKKKNSKQA